MILAICSASGKEEELMIKNTRFLMSLFFLANIAAGCATHTTVERESVQYSEPAGVERHTTTTTETSTNEDTGVLSGTVNVIGEVISLPFRAVGGLVRAIF
jgi:hypothetical protein